MLSAALQLALGHCRRKIDMQPNWFGIRGPAEIPKQNRSPSEFSRYGVKQSTPDCSYKSLIPVIQIPALPLPKIRRGLPSLISNQTSYGDAAPGE